MSREIWKPVIGFEGRYEVSSLGRVRSFVVRGAILRQTPKILSPGNNRGYHLYVLTYGDGRKKTVKCHRLVLEAFKGSPPKNKPHTLHKNGIRNDNRPENLSWGDFVDNGKDLRRHGNIKGEKNPKSKLSAVEVRKIKTQYKQGGITFERLAEEYGVSLSTIGFIMTNRTWSHVI